MKWINMDVRQPSWPEQNSFIASSHGQVWIQQGHNKYQGDVRLYPQNMYSPITHWMPLPSPPKIKRRKLPTQTPQECQP